MSSENSLTFVLSNRGIKNSSTAHQKAIYDGYQYRFKENNKNSSRYICTNTECYACITIKDNVIIKSCGQHYHQNLTESQFKIIKAKQELKKDVLPNKSKTL
ncbi:unnamed protein product [Brachionus calyciflorus]|uniref:FLYWCH-type domain-containing protein n=1 Tax=Brachionus calyciflorus TaxID=104777 RepID=A0A814I1B0_9BILA|nr:unnamed protein product [Brachionus calyciflorus]